MENQKEFNERLNVIRNVAIMEVNTWWGHTNAGYEGKIITENRELYSYQYYHIIPNELESKNINFISKDKELSIEEYNKVKEFIENEIIYKEFHDEVIYDVGFNVMVNYNGTRKMIKNNKAFNEDLKIYDKAKQLIDKLIK